MRFFLPYFMVFYFCYFFYYDFFLKNHLIAQIYKLLLVQYFGFFIQVFGHTFNPVKLMAHLCFLECGLEPTDLSELLACFLKVFFQTLVLSLNFIIFANKGLINDVGDLIHLRYTCSKKS